MSKRSEFFNRIKVIVKPKEKSKIEQEQKYEGYDIVVVEDEIEGNTFICTKERLEADKKYTSKISANNIEDGSQIAEYRLNALPAGRVCFGGYTDKECNKGKKIYSFVDVWYKIYGEPLEDRKFTKSELLEIVQEIKEKLKDAKYSYIYSITSKSINNGQNKFEGTKYFGGYLERNEEIQKLEMIDDDSLCIKTVGRNEEGNLIIKIGNQTIHTNGYVLNSSTIKSKDSMFEIKLIDSIGISRVYSRAKFTKEACKQIIKDYEKQRTEEER